MKEASKTILDKILAANEWYDKQPEPKRFSLFFIPMLVGQILFMNSGGWSIFWILCLVALGFGRLAPYIVDNK